MFEEGGHSACSMLLGHRDGTGRHGNGVSCHINLLGGYMGVVANHNNMLGGHMDLLDVTVACYMLEVIFTCLEIIWAKLEVL